jgi:GntR family transcriptional regulator, transcriptional repressor for pyruvate dehydrogenase complex
MASSAEPGGQNPPNSDIYTAIGRSTLPEQVALQVLTLIRQRQLRPGDRLPPERELAKILGVSRPVVREALAALAIMKVVNVRQGAGTFVTALEPQQLISHLDFVLPKDHIALVKLLEARRIVELANVRLAVARATEDQIERLTTLVDELVESIDDESRFRALDMEFHTAICEAADNFLLLEFMRIADILGEVSRQETGSLRRVRTQLVDSHREVVAGIADNDPDRAVAAMVEHFAIVESALDT